MHLNSFYEKAIQQLFYIVNRDMESVPFNLRPAQKRILKELHGMDIILKARQEGISSLILAIFALDFLTIENMRCVVVSHEEKATQRLLERVKYFLESMKRTWPQGEMPFTLKYNSRYELVNLDKNSTFYIGTAGARAFGHGDTINNLHLSEFSRWPDQERMLIGILQAVPKDGRVIIESTANGFGDHFYKLWAKNENEPQPFYCHFVPWFEDPEYVYPIKDDMEFIDAHPVYGDEQSLINKHHLKLEQMAWRRWKIDQMAGNLDTFAEQFPSNAEEAFIVSGNPVWSPHLLKWYLTQCEEPKRVGDLIGYNPIGFEENEKGYLKIWKMPQEFHNYVIGCLPDGEKVLTNDGYKDIETVGAENTLVDADGEIAFIKNFQRRAYSGELFEIKPFYTASGTKFTSEHPIQVLKDLRLYRDTAHNLKRYYKTDVVWKKAKDVKVNDVLRFPILYKKEKSNQEIVYNFSKQADIRIDRRLNKDIVLKEDFWFFVGLWLAEGWIRNGGNGELKNISIVLNGHKEKELADRVIGIIKNLFNRDVVYQHRRGTYEISLGCEPLFCFLKKNFGQKAGGKYISEWIKYLPQNLKLSLFRGYWLGDGCLQKDKSNKRINCVSISERLLNDFQDILFSLGFVGSVKLLRKEGVHFFKNKTKKCFTQKTYELNVSSRDSQILFDKWGMNIGNRFVRAKHKVYGWIENGYLYVKVHKINSVYFEGWVNNFETDTHSYCARLLSVHNCDVSEGKIVTEMEGGKERDASCIQVLDKTTYEQAACWLGRVDPDVLGRIVETIARFYNNAFVGVERNSIGLTTIIALRDLNYPNLYYRERMGLSSGDKMTAEIGWVTDVRTKELLVNETTNLLRDRRIKIYDDKTVGEMMSYVRDASGHANAAKSAFDDRVVSFMIAVMMLFKSKNITNFNPIESEDIDNDGGFYKGGNYFDKSGMPAKPETILDDGLGEV
mgnify:CR=1 FL=1